MKQLYLLICHFVLINSTLGQIFTTIEGSAYQKISYEKDSLAVQRASIILEINDTLKLMTLTDLDGKYEFRIKPFKGSVKIYSQVTSDTKVKGRKHPCVFSSRETKKIKLDPSEQVIYNANFELERGCCLPRIPELYFKSNSLEVVSDTAIVIDKPKIFEEYLFDIMNDNPTIVIEVLGNCSKGEKNKSELSLRRAELVRQMLVNKGIVKERIVLRAEGDKWPITHLEKPKTKAEMEFYKIKDQRISIRILSFDYGDKARKQSTDEED